MTIGVEIRLISSKKKKLGEIKMLYSDAVGDTTDQESSFWPSLLLLGRVLGEEGSGNSSKYATDGGYGKSGPIPLDYSVLSVGVLTLGLILFVEVCRHALDHSARHRPFFKAVLEMLYSECMFNRETLW